MHFGGVFVCRPRQAVTGPTGSAHITIGFPRTGLAWLDVVINGFSGAGSLGFFRGAPGQTDTPSNVKPGDCGARLPCKTALMTALMLALRHNTVTGGPRGIGVSSVRLAKVLPMWAVNECVHMIM